MSRRKEPYAELPVLPGRTLEDAKEWLRDMRLEGARCPCCTQLVKVYKRPLHSGMCVKLIDFFKAFGEQWGSRVELFQGGAEGDFAKLRYWDLVQESDDTRQDGGRAGWWRMTGVGIEFVRNKLLVPQYAMVYDGRCLSLRGKMVNIETSLGKRFNYNELMGIAI